MLQNSTSVYCDMETTANEGWTLLVTSVSNGWTGNQVSRSTITVYIPFRLKSFHIYFSLIMYGNIEYIANIWAKNTAFKRCNSLILSNCNSS